MRPDATTEVRSLALGSEGAEAPVERECHWRTRASHTRPQRLICAETPARRRAVSPSASTVPAATETLGQGRRCSREDPEASSGHDPSSSE